MTGLTRLAYAFSREALEQPHLRVLRPYLHPALLPSSYTLTVAQHGKPTLIRMLNHPLNSFASQSIMEYNGGSVIAMVGKDCVAIASDLRLGNQALGISSNFQKVRLRLLVNDSVAHIRLYSTIADLPHD